MVGGGEVELETGESRHLAADPRPACHSGVGKPQVHPLYVQASGPTPVCNLYMYTTDHPGAIDSGWPFRADIWLQPRQQPTHPNKASQPPCPDCRDSAREQLGNLCPAAAVGRPALHHQRCIQLRCGGICGWYVMRYAAAAASSLRRVMGKANSESRRAL